MWYLIGLIIVVPYVCFVFFGEGFNPFHKPRSPMERAQWRRGRTMALSSMLGMTATFVLLLTVAQPFVQSLAIGIVISLALAAVLSAKQIAGYFHRY